MNTIQTALSSARFNRLILWVGVVVFAAGALALVFKFAGGSDTTSAKPDKGFHPTLPKASHPLKNAEGATIKTFWQLDPAIRKTIRTFLVTAVARHDQSQAWNVVAPSVRKGYTHKSWTKANALPVIFYPVDNVRQAQYYLDYASTQEILIEVGLSAPKRYGMRPTSFQLGLVPVGKGASKKWLVDYFMPRWTPPVPEN
ncbi:MAG TPA: hypothetical protein VKB73_10475 [Gaiellaceae bacterium]|jgi:hypothetical protein|nr:hypothetical protein [Gaiellaceae bacterium]